MDLCLCSGADPWSANGDITEIYWDITFLQFQPKASGIRKHCSLRARDTSRFARSDRTANFWICSLNLGISNVINELGSINSFAQVIHLEKLDNISEKKPELGRHSWAFYVAEHRIICGLPAWLSMPSGEVKSKMGITEDQWRSAKKDYTDYTLQKHAKKKQDCKEPWTWQPTKDVVNLLASRPNSSAQSLLMALLSALLHYALCTKTGFSRRSASSNTSDWTEPSARTSIHEPSGLNLLWYPAFWGSHKVGRRLQMMDLGCK